MPKTSFILKIFIFIIFFLIVLIFYLRLKNNSNSFLLFFYNIDKPFLKISLIGNFFKDLLSLSSLRSEVLSLREENKKLKSIEQEYYHLKEENLLLKTSLNLEKDEIKSIPAKIVFLDPSPLPFYFWINKGEKDGLKEGLNVIDQNKILIGALTNCQKNFCQGEFIFAPERKISVKISGKSIKGIAYRDKNGAYLLTFIVKEANIEEGDLVETEGDNIFRKGLLLAKVRGVRESILKEQGYQEFFLEPLSDSRFLTDVLVIVNSFY